MAWCLGDVDVDDSVVIGPLDAGDRNDVIGLWGRAGLIRPWNDPDSDIDLALSTPESTVLVAKRSDRVAGAVMVGHDGHRGAIYYLAVDPEAQRGGIGRALVAAAEDWCKAHGHAKINLLVRRENAKVLAFYEAIGYRDTHCVSLYRAFDPERAEREAAQKAAWAEALKARE
ncbi:GNAT family acetyltransferase [Oryzibacter oryziterrae]|uniref:GNAT family acetyltransferase n=1 Tax=Oryzibacter oryziterrae TaxID=2766474 RepID=UPI001F005A06|nr:GNAT family acetyltransferase [Oryzibacter oryziterrae]